VCVGEEDEGKREEREEEEEEEREGEGGTPWAYAHTLTKEQFLQVWEEGVARKSRAWMAWTACVCVCVCVCVWCVLVSHVSEIEKNTKG
jgi:hypothetical protein